MRPTKLLLLVFTAFLLGCETSPPGVAPADAGPDRVDAESGGASPGFVVAYNELAREAGARILEQGGSAADAFIATTLVEYVIAPSGVTTLAGPLGVLVVEENGQVVSLEANMNAPESPEGRYDPAAPTIGDTALVPGAPRALEALSQRYGTLPWADVVEPARRIAEEGFVIDRNFAFGITSRRDVLERTEYGRETFFDAAGEPRRTGENFRQPVLAEFLARFAAEGADAVYTGAFAERFRDTVEAAGGAITLEELARYRVSFEEPWVLRYRDADVYSISGRAYGGAFVLMGLSALEHGGYSLNGRSEVDRLELLIRTARATYFEDWLFDARVAQREEVVARLADPSALLGRIQAGASESIRRGGGSHSFHVTARDPSGMVVTGTHTIHSLGYGEGLFVDGVVLSAGGTNTHLIVEPGGRMLSALSNHVALRDGELIFAGGTFGGSLIEAQLQLVAGAVDEGLPADVLAARGRFGSFPYDFETFVVNVNANWLSTDVSAPVADELRSRGLDIVQEPFGDLGFGTFLVHDGNTATGGALASWIEGGVSYAAP